MSAVPSSMQCSCGHSFSQEELAAAQPRVFAGGRSGWAGTCSACGRPVGQWDLTSQPRAQSTRGNREDVSAVIAVLQDKYRFKTSEVAKYCGLKTDNVLRWRKGVTAPKQGARNLKRLVRIAEMLEKEGNLAPDNVRAWFMYRMSQKPYPRPGDLLPKKYLTVLKYAREYCESTK